MSTILGTKELKLQKEIAEIRAVMRQTGWTNELLSQINNYNIQPVIPTVQLAGSDWKAVLQKLKQKVIDERTKHHNPIESSPLTYNNSEKIK